MLKTFATLLGTILAQWRIPYKSVGSSGFNVFGTVRVDAHGNVYVVERGDAPHIMRLTPTRKAIPVPTYRDMCSAGDIGMSLPHPCGPDVESIGSIAFDGDGNIYATDRRNGGIVKLSRAGKWLGEWDEGLRLRSGQFGATAVAVDAAHNIYVTDSTNNYVQKLSPGGHAQWHFTSGPFAGPQGNELYGPPGIAVDRQGDVYVADDHDGEIVKLSSTGRDLAEWSVSGK